MIKTQIEKNLFELFTKHGCQDFQLFSELNIYIENLVKDTIGEKDAEYYEILRQLSSLENNTGWDTDDKHNRKLALINQKSNMIIDRSDEYLP